jgi:hypothetical protein
MQVISSLAFTDKDLIREAVAAGTADDIWLLWRGSLSLNSPVGTPGSLCNESRDASRVLK